MEGLILANDNESDDDDNQTCIDPRKCEETIQHISAQREERQKQVCFTLHFFYCFTFTLMYMYCRLAESRNFLNINKLNFILA